MNTTALYVKIEPKTKKEAQKVAEDLGLSLSAVVNGFLKQFIKTKTITFSAHDEIPNKATRLLLRQADEEYRKGKTSPAFKTGEESITWLEKQGVL